MTDISDIEVLDKDVAVTLIITAKTGEVLYISQVGGEPLAHLLKSLSHVADYPLQKQEFQFDDIGQEIYYTHDKLYFESLIGSFSALSWATARGLTQFTGRQGSMYSFALTY